MASKIKVIGMYRSRVNQGNTVQKPELIRALSRATGLVEGSIDQVIKELRDQIIEFNHAGRAVKVEGLGTYAPNISLDGTFDLQYRADTAFGNALNIPGIFTGTIVNRENIGKTGEELVSKWNQANPEDPVTTE
jgi:hypothetical protein